MALGPQRRDAEESIRLSEKKYQTLLKSLPQKIAYKDRNSVYISCNENYACDLRITPDEVAGKTDYDFFPLELAEKYRKDDQRVMESGKVEELEEGYLLNGELIWVSSVKAPVRDDEGKVRGVLVIFWDITERKRAAEKLRESEEQLRLAVAATELGTWDLNPVTGVLQWSERCKQLFGLPPDAAVTYQTFLDRLHPGDRQPTDEVVQEALDPAGTGEYDIEYRALQPDGTVRWIAATGQAFFGEVDGKTRATRFIGTVRDITERKRAEEEIRSLNAGLERRVAERTAELLAANKELETFSYSVSHDLRAPLRAMDGFCQALLEDYGDRLDSEGQRHLQRVRAASQRMDQLIDGILELSRTGRSEMRCTRVDLSGLAETIDLELRRMNPGRLVDFVVAPGLVVYADANLLRVVLANLLGNAWKYTSKNPQARIELGTVEHDGETAYFVRDDGAGFDMAYVNKLFGPFQRLHSPTEFAGTGVGLATVQRIIHRHGGRVWAEGKVGKGAIFFFTLARE